MNHELLMKAIEIAMQPKNFTVTNENIYVNNLALPDTFLTEEDNKLLSNCAIILYKMQQTCMTARTYHLDSFEALQKNYEPNTYVILNAIINEAAELHVKLEQTIGEIYSEREKDIPCKFEESYNVLSNELYDSEKEELTLAKAKNIANGNLYLFDELNKFVILSNEYEAFNLSNILCISYHTWELLISLFADTITSTVYKVNAARHNIQ